MTQVAGDLRQTKVRKANAGRSLNRVGPAAQPEDLSASTGKQGPSMNGEDCKASLGCAARGQGCYASTSSSCATSVGWVRMIYNQAMTKDGWSDVCGLILTLDFVQQHKLQRANKQS